MPDLQKASMKNWRIRIARPAEGIHEELEERVARPAEGIHEELKN